MTPEMHPEIRKVLEIISFFDRYKTIVDNNQEFENRFHDYQSNKALEIIRSFGYSVSYNSKENFFKILEQNPPFQFQFNISLGGGVIDFIWDVKKNDERLSFGVSGWSPIASSLGTGDRVKKLTFTSYENLQETLKNAFAIYEDFKAQTISLL